MTATIDPALLGRAVETLRGMAYEHRLHILVLLRTGEATPAMLAASVPAHFTAVSHHLRYLVDAGLVRRRRRGRNVYYEIADHATGRLVDEVLSHANGGVE